MTGLAEERTHAIAAWHDRLFRLAVGASLASHVVLLGTQLVLARTGWWTLSGEAKLIYHREPIESTSHWEQQEARGTRARAQELARTMTVRIAGSSGGAAAQGLSHRPDLLPDPTAGEGLGSGAAGAGDQGWAQAWSAKGGAWASAIDLTDIAQAAQGNPVLLSYFSAIREQIQTTANAQAWAMPTDRAAGIAFVGFVITKTGDLQSAGLVPGRSTALGSLCEVALKIVKASAPFPPFPPSFEEATKTVIVPLEFAPGS